MHLTFVGDYDASTEGGVTDQNTIL
jgi:hypothetical protein